MSKCDWGYTETNGPLTWPSKFPQAAGSRQSPVDVETGSATSDTSLQSRPLTWKYHPSMCKSIINPGYGWRVDVHNDRHSELIGGPLGTKYKLEQFHCHWGRDSQSGSEHTVDGKMYSGELHLVHWNCEKYKTFGEAAQHPDGLAVLGVFLEVSDKKHEEIEKIVSLIQNIVYRGQETVIKENIDPTNLLPKRTQYWTYLGSLTTPPCTESVTWILFKEPIQVSEEQLAVFRSLRSYSQQEICPVDDEHNGHVLYNFRPPLPLGNRELRECGSV